MDVSEVKRLERKIDRARDSEDFKQAIEICMELGAYFSSFEKYEDALAKYKEAMCISEEKGWKAEGAVSHRMIAETYLSLGEYKEAVKYANMYLNHSKIANIKIEEQRGYATKGRIYFCWAEFLINEKSKCIKEIKKLLKESLFAYEKSLKICEGELNEVDMREKQEMKARLFQNLGLVMGSLGKYKEASAHFATAIQINKSQNFKENLYWCYINQGEYFLRAGECANAGTYFDLAIKVSSSTENTSEALRLKAKSYLKTGNCSEAKSILREAYKLHLGKDPEVVEQLRIVVYLCKIGKMIDSTPEKDYQARKKLFEKQGDAYCALRQYGQGVESYLKMLECAQRDYTSNKELLPCYSSLAQTYRDNEQYSSALIYCQKELEQLNENSIEASKTYLFLAELYELLDYDFDTIHTTYKKALEIARELGDKSQEILVLKNLIQTQKDFGYISLVEENEKQLDKLLAESGDGFDCDTDGNVTENFTFDVDDDELFSDVEDKPRHQIRKSAYKIKRNQKGETELHVATIKGNYTKVKQLIEKGHPVNEKDLAGWTVLHEACNHGHIDIVNLLINSGADINNPGGEECGGITPLHDAAENGHLAVIKLLLKKGACPAVLTNDGDTPLDCLKRWRSRGNVSDGEAFAYDKLCDALKTHLDSSEFKQKSKRMAADLFLNKRRERRETQTRKPDAEETRKKPSGETSATELYRTAIEGVRRKPNAKILRKKEKKVNAPLICEEEMDLDLEDAWLEDDMEPELQRPKRRKILDDREDSPPIEEHPPPVEEDPEPEESYEEFVMDIPEIVENSGRESCPSPVFNIPKTKPNQKPRQEEKSPPGESSEMRESKSPSPEIIPEPKTNPENFLKFKIQIMDDVFLVPVCKARMDELTVDWLAKEATDRYGKIYGKRPVVLVMSEDDAIASGSDPIALFLGSKIKTRILGWKGETLSEKYEEESSRYRRGISLSVPNTKPNLAVMNALDKFSKTGDLILAGLHLELQDVAVVFKILEKEKSEVGVLDLSRNYLRDDGLESVLNYLTSHSIERLYLRSNGISSSGIEYFRRRLADVPERSRKRIRALDFSFNILGNESAVFLDEIVDELENLEYLGTEYCRITARLKWKRAEDVSEGVNQATRDIENLKFKVNPGND